MAADPWPGTTRQEACAAEGLWHGQRVPSHHETSPPASDYDVQRLQNVLDTFSLGRLQEDLHLSEIGRKLVEITRGNTFSMDPVWLHPSNNEGLSLLETTSARPVGSATAAAVAR